VKQKQKQEGKQNKINIGEGNDFFFKDGKKIQKNSLF